MTDESEAKIDVLNRKISNLEKLLDISRTLNSKLNLDDLLLSIVHAAKEVTHSEDASILLLDKRTGALYFEATTNDQKELLSHIAIPLDDSIAGWIVREGKPALLNDVTQDPRHFDQTDKEIDFETKGLLGVPLQVKGKTIGVLETLNPENNGSYTDEDIYTITILASQAAVAIENARLFEQSDHIAEIIHELRTPLTAVVGFSKLLIARDDIGRENRISYLETINQEADRLNDMLGKFLGLARLETQRMRFNMVKTDLNSIVVEATELLQPQAGSNNITIHCHLPDDIIYAMVDPDHMKQVLINLLSNAVKYNRPAGNISVAVQQIKTGNVEISVSDTGLGMPDDLIGHIFDRFYRVSEHTEKADGNGLGLSIVKEIVDAHSGKICVESKIDEGSTFTVTLPLSQKKGDHKSP
ncbi:MAG: GAF domain-containing sensor histidine kinase [Chloroflexota bacterium]